MLGGWVVGGEQAIYDGQVELARFMLQDLLTIRADRDRSSLCLMG